jgi:hypothetical protein
MDGPAAHGAGSTRPQFRAAGPAICRCARTRCSDTLRAAPNSSGNRRSLSSASVGWSRCSGNPAKKAPGAPRPGGHAAHRAAPMGVQPALVPGRPDSLSLAPQRTSLARSDSVSGRSSFRSAFLAGHSHEAHRERRLAEDTRRHTGGDDQVGAHIQYGLLRSRKNFVRELHIRPGTQPLQLGSAASIRCRSLAWPDLRVMSA